MALSMDSVGSPMDNSPLFQNQEGFSVIPDPERRFQDPADAEFLAGQISIAQDDPSPDTYKKNVDLVQQSNGVQDARQSIANRAAARDSNLQYNMYQEAIAKGDTETAWNLLSVNRDETAKRLNSPEFALEQEVVDRGVAHQVMTDTNMYSEIASQQYSDDTKRQLMINNFLTTAMAPMQDYNDPGFTGDPEKIFDEASDAFDNIFRTEVGPTMIPRLWARQLKFIGKAAKAADVFSKDFYADALAVFASTPTAILKQEISGKKGHFFLPGEAGRAFHEAITTMPVEDLPAYLSEVEGTLKEASVGNALRAFAVAWDLVYASNVIDGKGAKEQFDLWKKTPTLIIPVMDTDGRIQLDENGQEMMQEVPNVLYELYAQGGEGATATLLGAIDTITSKSAVQTVIDNPIMDAIAVVGGTKNALKLVARMRTITAALGRPAVAQSIVNQVAHGNKVTKDVFEYLSANVNRTGFTDPHLAAEVRRVQLQAAENLEYIPTPARANVDPSIVSETTLNIKNNPNLFQQELQYSYHEISEGNNYITAIYGASDGAGFASEAAAKAWAANKGIPDPILENPPSSGWFVRTRTPLGDAASYSTDIEKTRFLDSVRFSLGFGKYGWTANTTTSVRSGEKASASALNTGAYKRLFEPAFKEMQALDKKGVRRLRDMVSLGKRAPSRADDSLQGKWFTDAEYDAEYFTKYDELPTMQDKIAYRAYHTSSDLSFALANKGAHDEAASLGVTTWRFDNPNAELSFLGKDIGRDTPSARFFAKLPDGSYTNDADALRAAMRDEDVFIIKTHGDFDLDGHTVTHILGKRGEVKDVGLPRILLSYQEGGTRIYKHPFFLKQQGATRIHTLGNFSSKKEALKYQTKMREVVRLYKGFLDEMRTTKAAGALNPASERAIRAKWDALLQPLDQRFRTNTLEQMVARGDFDIKREFHVLYDRQPFPGQGEAKLLDTPLMQRKGKLVYSHRGETLFEDGTANLAELVDPFEALAFQQGHAIKAAGYSDYAVEMMQRWAVKYRPFLVNSQDTTSLRQMFLESKFPQTPVSGITKTQQWAADAERAHILRVLKQPDAVSARLALMRHAVAEKIATLAGDADWIPGYFRTLKNGKLAESDVLSFLKGSAYNITMGLFNATHLWLQALGSGVAVMMHPIHGVNAVLESTVFASLRIVEIPRPSAIKIGKVFERSGMYKKGEFIKVWDLYTRSGLHNIAASDTTLDTLAAVDKVGAGALLHKVSTAGRVFVYKGEQIARNVTFQIARRIADEQAAKGKFVRWSDEYAQFVQGETNRLQLGMMSGMEAAWSRNPLTALGMQMLQYPIKATETFLGLNRQLTAAEKFNFAVGSVLMHGSYGVPFGPQLLEYYNEKSGNQLSDSEFRVLLLGGFDAGVREIFGQDTAFASKLGYGDFHYSFVMNFMDKSLVDFVGGIALGDIKKLADAAPAVADILMMGYEAGMISSSDIATVGEAVLVRLGDALSGASNYHKAYILARYNMLMDARAVTLIEAHSKYSAFATALGITSANEALYRLDAVKAGSREEELKVIASAMAEIFSEQNIARVDFLKTKDSSEFEPKMRLYGAVVSGLIETSDLNPDELERVKMMATTKMQTDRTIQRRMRSNKFNVAPGIVPDNTKGESE